MDFLYFMCTTLCLHERGGVNAWTVEDVDIALALTGFLWFVDWIALLSTSIEETETDGPDADE